MNEQNTSYFIMIVVLNNRCAKYETCPMILVHRIIIRQMENI